MAQCLWTGGYAGHQPLRTVGSWNLRCAREAGLVCTGYINASPWYPASAGLAAARDVALEEWGRLRVVWTDVELDGLGESEIRDTVEALEGDGKRTGIYSAYWFWAGRMGNPQWPWLLEKGIPVWEAYYDGDPDIDFLNRRFGPWGLQHVVGEQWQNSVVLDSVEVDLNIFDLDWILGTEDDVKLKLIRKPGSPDIYLCTGAALYHVPDWDTFVAMGWRAEDVEEVPEGHALWRLPVMRYGKL